MVSAVFDTSVLVSAFLTRHHSGGVSGELLRFVREGKIQLHLSADIIAEVLLTLTRNPRAG
jgi:predicted nucleic acid-binding protein